MDDPIFKLEKVVQTRGDEPLEDFEGPLDLILYLLSKNKIEIQDIPIALILEQYQAYLEKRKRMDLEVASEFITMAAQLMFIKTRMLLNLIKTYFDLGGGHIQFNCVSSETLCDAQEHPQNYKNLVVRVAGFSSYFTRLYKGVQDEIIKRTEYQNV